VAGVCGKRVRILLRGFGEIAQVRIWKGIVFGNAYRVGKCYGLADMWISGVVVGFCWVFLMWTSFVDKWIFI
jgi:hypothetical protein